MSDLGTEHLVQIALHPCPSCCSREEFPGLPAVPGSAPDHFSFLDAKKAAGVMVRVDSTCSKVGLKSVHKTCDY